MLVPTSVRPHDVTSPKRRSADARITDTKLSCDCQQHVCGKTRTRNDQRSVDSDREAGSDYAHCDKGKYKSAPDVVADTGRTALRQSPVLRRNRAAPRVKSNYVSHQAVASPDCVTVLAYRDLTAARDTDIGLLTDLRHHL